VHAFLISAPGVGERSVPRPVRFIPVETAPRGWTGDGTGVAKRHCSPVSSHRTLTQEVRAKFSASEYCSAAKYFSIICAVLLRAHFITRRPFLTSTVSQLFDIKAIHVLDRLPGKRIDVYLKGCYVDCELEGHFVLHCGLLDRIWKDLDWCRCLQLKCYSTIHRELLGKSTGPPKQEAEVQVDLRNRYDKIAVQWCWNWTSIDMRPLWDVALCCLVEVYRRFAGAWYTIRLYSSYSSPWEPEISLKQCGFHFWYKNENRLSLYSLCLVKIV
jgi:hypothetical protein